MATLSRYLLYLYPAAHRMEFGEEMSEVLSERQNDIGKRGALARWISNGREIGGLLMGARARAGRDGFVFLGRVSDQEDAHAN